jgi:hypothetical protein
VKWVYSYNKIDFDFNESSINFQDKEIIKQRSFILLEEVLEYLVGVNIGKVNFVQTKQIHQKNSCRR